MKLTTYDNQEITVTKEQAQKLAETAGLIAVTQPSGVVYVSAKNIASITQGGDSAIIKQLQAKT